jgi:hypothetical protein
MKRNEEARALVSRGCAALIGLANVSGWRAHGRPHITEWVDTSGASAEYFVRFSLHNPTSQRVTVDYAAIMMGNEVLFPLSSYSQTRFDARRFPLDLPPNSSEFFDFPPNELANLVARHGGRGKVILHGVCRSLDTRYVKGRPILFDIRSANSPPFKGSLTAQGPIAQEWAWLSDRYPSLQMVRRIGLADDVLRLAPQDMVAIRQKADTRDQPGSAYNGQPIVDFSMWKTGDIHGRGAWRAVMVLADKSRIELVEDRD